MSDDARLLIKIEDDGAGIGDTAQAQSGFPSPPGRDPDLSFPDLTPPPDLRNPDILARDLAPPADVGNQGPLPPMDISGMEGLLRRLVDLTEQEVALLGGLTPDRSDPQQASQGTTTITGVGGSSDSMGAGSEEVWKGIFGSVRDSTLKLKDTMEKAVLQAEKESRELDHLKKFANFLNPFQMIAGGIGQAVGGGDVASTGMNLAAGAAKMVPGPGMAIGFTINALTTVATSLQKSMDALVRRGAELAPFSGELTAANVRRDVEFLKSDIREAQIMGKSVAKLTDLSTDFEVRQRERMAHVKAQFADFTTDSFEALQDAQADTAGRLAQTVMGGKIPFFNYAFQSTFGTGVKPPEPMRDSPADDLLGTYAAREWLSMTTGAGAGRDALVKALSDKMDAMIDRLERVHGDLVDWRDMEKVAAFARDNFELGSLLMPIGDGPPLAPAPAVVDRIRRGPVFGGF